MVSQSVVYPNRFSPGDESILRSSSLRIESTLIPWRFVLRKCYFQVSPYVIHRENMGWDTESQTWVHVEYHSGKYFRELKEAEIAYQKLIQGDFAFLEY